MIDKNKLRAKIAEAGLTQTELANITGIGKNSLSLKINGKTSITLEQIDAICDALNITDSVTKALIFLA